MASLRLPAQMARTAVAGPSRWVQASSFATSSRVGLDFTAPARSSGKNLARQNRKIAAQQGVVGMATIPSADATPVETVRWHPLPTDLYRNAAGIADRAPTHTLHVMSTRNNTLLTFCDALGPMFRTTSGGTDKVFRKTSRQSYEAAHQAALKTFALITATARALREQRADRMAIQVAYRGMEGLGRDAVHSALGGADGAEVRQLVVRIEDRTHIKIGGTRARKPRRV
ncbi:37S ribosomal protein S18, mitochondrial [Vanrija pseudolonga]|uniref:37S ribosomal protein S18, mitochondrial n=1 Tax=Vanrija pseudolonga TaxID=143232 RepID=A0AAF0Y9Z2_9TREE|nr:37S ribosomal protein S18, mitochondrial [Vanrija pseudolonga]